MEDNIAMGVCQELYATDIDKSARVVLPQLQLELMSQPSQALIEAL